MLNQIDKQFEEFMVAMYGNKEISDAQEKDMEKAFYAGMLVTHTMMISLDEDEEIAIKQLENLSKQIIEKAEGLK